MARYFGALSVAVATALAGCATPGTSQGERLAQAPQERRIFADLVDSGIAIPAGAETSQSHAKAVQAVRFIAQMDLPRASKSINAALQLDGRDSYLHFLNGFVYHLQARQGDSQKSELAVEGYRTALRLDPGNWIAQEFLGLAYLDLKQFRQAKEQFAQVLLMAPDTGVSMYGLMVTSYLTGDPQMACAMADRLRDRAAGPDPAFIRSSVSVYASCGKFDEAERMRAELDRLDVDRAVVDRTERRLAQWEDFYRTRSKLGQAGGTAQQRFAKVSLGNAADDGRIHLASAFKITTRQEPSVETQQAPVDQPLPQLSSQPQFNSQSDVEEAPPAAPEPSPVAATGDGAPGMVLVDVVIISTQETISSSKGINLLNALTLQLGSATAPAYSWTFDSSSVDRTVITKAVTIPALAYSLNIANATSAQHEVLARPTLAAIESQPSEFFAGVNGNAGVLSTSTLGSPQVVPVDKRFGVKLAVTPNFLPDGMVKLKVDAQRTFVVPSAPNDGFAYRFDVSETSTDANVVMKLGDTLVLAGLTEKEFSKSRDGVPGLQDVPVAQYLFASKRESDFQRSALILITPRAPIYTARAESAAASESERALRDRLGFSATIPSNVESIVNYMQDSELFRQFRQGDVAMDRWDRSGTTAERLRQALSFLYY